MDRHTLPAIVSAAVLVLAGAAIADAGGPLLLRAPGQPFRWANGGLNIPGSFAAYGGNDLSFLSMIFKVTPSVRRGSRRFLTGPPRAARRATEGVWPGDRSRWSVSCSGVGSLPEPPHRSIYQMRTR